MALTTTKTVQVRGLAELEQALRQLPIELEQRIVRASLRDGGKFLADGVQRRIPRLTGRTAATVEVAVKKDPTYGLKAVIGFSKAGKRGHIGRFLEFGTKYLRRRAFMQTTLEQDFQPAMAVFVVRLRDRFEATVRRLAKKAPR